MILEYQGEKVLICYAVSEITDWVVVNVIPLNSLLNHVSIIQRLTILIWMVLFLLAMFFSRIFSRRITKPVERLVRAMQMIGEGNFEQRLPVNGEDEIQYLTEKYNEMRKENKKFQVSAASYGWLLASVKMSWYIKYCGWKKLTAPVLLFQAERDDFVSVNALRKFAEKISCVKVCCKRYNKENQAKQEEQP